MKLILIDGGPASGKNTLGALLVEKFNASAVNAVLLDKDRYIEHFNPSWIWDSEDQREKDRANALINIAQDTEEYLKKGYTVVVIGIRFLTRDAIGDFVGGIGIKCASYVYHLSVPFALRERRLHQRGPYSLIDLPGDQKERDAIKDWPGYVYANIHSPEMDAANLMAFIQSGEGLIAP